MTKKLIATMLIMLSGCSTTATITRVNGRETEGKIKRGNSSAVFIETDEGQEVAISRSEIEDIDHPGNPAVLIGGLLGAYGALNIAVGVDQCDANGGAYCTGVFLPAAAGVSMIVWGLMKWTGSISAAENSSPTSTSRVPEPPPVSAFSFSASPNPYSMR